MTKTFDSGCYDLADSFLQDSGVPASNERVTKLASLIQQTIEDFIEHEEANYDPTPYCSYGHMTKAQCDCGPIAENE